MLDRRICLAACLGSILAGAGCNAISGIDGFTFEGRDDTGAGGSPGVGGGGAGAAGAGGDGGAGGGAPPLPLCDNEDLSLIACYALDGSVEDASPYQNATTSVGVAFGPGVQGLAVSLEASSEITLADAPFWDVSEYTVELWINPALLPVTGERMGLIDSNARLGIFLYPEGELRCAPVLMAAVSAGAEVAPAGVWTHVACVHDGMNGLIYVNGKLAAQLQVGAVPVTDGVTVLGGNAPTGDRFVGLLDGVRVWNVARTAAQICEAAGADDC